MDQGGVDGPRVSVFIFVQRGKAWWRGGWWRCHLTTCARSGCLGVCFEKVHMRRVQACMHAWRASFGGVMVEVSVWGRGVGRSRGAGLAAVDVLLFIVRYGMVLSLYIWEQKLAAQRYKVLKCQKAKRFDPLLHFNQTGHQRDASLKHWEKVCNDISERYCQGGRGKVNILKIKFWEFIGTICSNVGLDLVFFLE